MCSSVNGLRKRANKLNLKLSEKQGDFALYEFLSSANAWVPVEQCWGAIPHSLSFDDVTWILDEYSKA